MERILKSALIGTGRLSTRRIYPYLSTAGMKVQAVAARTLAHAEEKCALYGGRPYTHWHKMIDQEKPDVVIACVGPELHYEAARFCIARNIPIYTEKPPASNAAQVADLIALATRHGSFCMTGFKKRYSACYQRARQWLNAFPVSDWECFSMDWYAGKFDLDRNPKETVLLDFGIHALDLVTWLFGPAEKVVTFAKGWDSFAVTLKMANGMVGTLTFSDHRSFEFPGEETEITIAGGHAMSIHNSTSWRIQKEGCPVEWFEPPTCLAGGDSGYNTGMLKELEVFADCVRQGETPLENLETSYHTMRLYEAITRSIKNGGELLVLENA
jgi:predicted dehydrogenase